MIEMMFRDNKRPLRNPGGFSKDVVQMSGSSPLQVYFSSMVDEIEHPSPSRMLPSSHSSSKAQRESPGQEAQRLGFPEQ